MPKFESNEAVELTKVRPVEGYGCIYYVRNQKESQTNSIMKINLATRPQLTAGEDLFKREEKIHSMHESDVVAIQPCSDTEQRIDGNFYSRGENLPNPSYKPVLFVYDTSGNFIKFNEMKRGENTILQCLETYKNSIAKDWLESTHQFESICISERFINMRHRAFESEKYGYGRFWPISDEAKIDRSYNVKQNQSLVPIPIPCSNAIIYHIVTDSVQVLQTQATRRNLVFANA